MENKTKQKSRYKQNRADFKLLDDPKYPVHKPKIAKANLEQYDPSKSGGK